MAIGMMAKASGAMTTELGASARSHAETVKNKYSRFLFKARAQAEADALANHPLDDRTPGVNALAGRSGALTIDNTPLTEDIYSLFAEYLQLDDEDKVSATSAMNYMTALERLNRESLKHNDAARPLDPDYVARLRAITRAVYQDEGQVGATTATKEPAPLMLAADLATVCDTLFNENDVGRRVHSSRDRTLLSMQWSAIGQGLDLGSLRYADLEWRNDSLVLTATHETTGETHELRIVHAALNWTLDPLHALACQLASKPEDTSRHVFQHLAQFSNGAKKYINQVLKRLSDKDHYGALTPPRRRRRHAATTTHSDGQFPNISSRGSWSLDALATILENSQADALQRARQLAGWSNPRLPHTAPILTTARRPVDNDDAVLDPMFAFADKLFLTYSYGKTARVPARLRDVLAATLLLYLSDTMAVSETHGVHAALFAAADSVGITQDELVQRGHEIRRAFSLANAHLLRATVDGEDTARPCVPTCPMEASMDQLLVLQQATALELTALNAKVDAQNGSVRTMQADMNKLMVTCQETNTLVATLLRSVINMTHAVQASRVPIIGAGVTTEALESLEAVRDAGTAPDAAIESEHDDAGASSSKWPIHSLSGIKFNDGLFMFLANDLVKLPRDPKSSHQKTLKAALCLAQRSPEFRDVVSAYRLGRCTRSQLFDACERVSEAIYAEIDRFADQHGAEAKAAGSTRRKRHKTGQRAITSTVQFLKRARHSRNQTSLHDTNDGSRVINV